MTSLRIGSRKSDLAVTQTTLVADALRAAHPDLEISIELMTTHGDRTQQTNAPGAGWGQGVFVKELEAALLAGTVDIAVHSLKDVPPILTPGLALVAFPERADTGDVLVSADGLTLDRLP